MNEMNVTDIKIEDFNYPLPEERIASHPLQMRDHCKLLLRNHDGSLEEHVFTELPALLPADSMLVYNNTRVINARLRFRKPGGARIEVFCLEPVAPADYQMAFAAEGRAEWSCFVGNSKRWKDAPLEMALRIGEQDVLLTATRTSKSDSGSTVEFTWQPSDLTDVYLFDQKSHRSSSHGSYSTQHSHVKIQNEIYCLKNKDRKSVV